ncbi:guanylate cyclase, partial [Elysia marginata]
NCADGYNETDLYLTVNTQYYFGFSSLYLVESMRYFGWTSAWIVTGRSFKWQNTASLLLPEMHRAQITVNGDTTLDINDRYSPSLESKVGYSEFFAHSQHHTRVYIFLGEFESLILFARQLKKSIPNWDQYVVLAAGDSAENLTVDNFHLNFHERNNPNQSSGEDTPDAFHNVLVLRPMVPKGASHGDFEQRVKIPETAYFLYDATMLYGQAVMALMATPGANPLEGAEIINWLRCREHNSVSGNNLYIHSNGRSEDAFTLYAMETQDGVIQKNMWRVGNFVHSGSAVKSLTFFSLPNEGRTSENWIIVGVVSGFLIVCLLVGVFLARKCLEYQENKRMRWKIDENEIEYPSPDQVKEMLTPARSRKRKVSNNFLQSFYLAQNQETDVMFSGTPEEQKARQPPVVMYRGNRVFEKRLTLKDLELSRPLVSQLKLMKDLSHENVNEFKGALISPQCVRIFSQYCPRRSLKDILEKDDLPLHDMFTTSIVQDLINGISYIHDSKLGFHGNLKSSNCLVDNRWTVKITDFGLGITKPARTYHQDEDDGISYIHESKLGFHGNLKSSNCLVDNRWTVKITDFGLGITKPARTYHQDEDDVSLWSELLWMAPELLALHVCPSTISSDSSKNNSGSDPNLITSVQTRSLLNHSASNTSSHSTSAGGGVKAGRKDSKFFGLTQGRERSGMVTGTQKGDVYSFAIILYELYGHSGPWGNSTMSAAEIVNSLLNQRWPTPRPDLACLRKVNCDDRVIQLIQACWDDNADLRPDFRTGVRIKFQPIQQMLLSPNIIDNMLAKMEKYTDDLEVMVEERTDELKREKKMTDNLLLRMLPRSVAEKLKRGQPVTPEQYEQVTIYFSDIVGFTEMSADSTPMEVVDLLNELYTCFDTIIETFDVYKVETIGDAYMVVSGLPMRNGDRHAGEIASMALQLLDEIKRKQFKIRGRTNNTLKIRIGIHSGPCCAGVVGKKMPRYCLFGDTINTASRLESTGEALKVHCSEDCKLILDKLGGYHLEERGLTPMKGKGSLMTYFLTSEEHIHRQRRIQLIQKSESPWRCVSASNIDYSERHLQVSSLYSSQGQAGPGMAAQRRRHGRSSGSLLSYPPLVAAKEINSKSLTRVTLPLLSGKTSASQQETRLDASSDNSRPDGGHPGQLGQSGSINGPAIPGSASAFARDVHHCSALQPVGFRHSSYMSPIAEDPRPPLPATDDPLSLQPSSSDSGSASMEESNGSLSNPVNPTRERVLSAPAPSPGDSSTDCLLPHPSPASLHGRQSTDCPKPPGLNPLNSSFDQDRSASEPPEWIVRQESAVFVEPQSPTEITSTSSSFPSIRLQEEPLAPDSPFSHETAPSETDSLLESSWASSNHPFIRVESIPAKSADDAAVYQRINSTDSNPFLSEQLTRAQTTNATQFTDDQMFENGFYGVDSSCSHTDPGENSDSPICGETIL